MVFNVHYISDPKLAARDSGLKHIHPERMQIGQIVGYQEGDEQSNPDDLPLGCANLAFERIPLPQEQFFSGMHVNARVDIDTKSVVSLTAVAKALNA